MVGETRTNFCQSEQGASSCSLCRLFALLLQAQEPRSVIFANSYHDFMKESTVLSLLFSGKTCVCLTDRTVLASHDMQR